MMDAEGNTLVAPMAAADANRPLEEGPCAESVDSLPWEMYEWMPMAFGIMVAGAAYPIVLSVAYIGLAAMFYAYQALMGTLSPGDLDLFGDSIAGLAAAVLCVILGGGFVGFFWAGAVSLVVLPLANLFARSLRLRVGFVPLAATCGGAVGFAAVLPMSFSFVFDGFLGHWLQALIMLAVGPALTTVLGQIGGAWGVRGAARAGSNVPVQRAEVSAAPRVQFRIRHVLWISVWLSGLLTVIKLIGLPFELMLPLLVGWCIFQAGTLYLGRLTVCKLWPWWRAWRTASRST